MMSIIKRIPWLSLTLALLTYCCLGWVMSEERIPPILWVAVIAVITVIVGALATPWPQMNRYTNLFFKSNSRTFAITVLGAFSLFLMIAWFKLFLDSLLIACATILARIDFQSAGFRYLDTLGILYCVAFSGIAMGVALNRFF